MAKKKRRFKLILLLLCGVLVLSHCGLSSAIFRSTFRNQLSAMLGCKTRMTDAAFSALMGSGHIKALAISNPADYPAGDAITLENVRFRFRQASFWEDRLSVDELILEGGAIHYQEVDGASNISTILASIKEYSEKYPDGRQMQIERLAITGWTCFATFSPTDTRATQFKIPDVEIIGLKGTGAEVSKQISIEVATQIRKKLNSPGTLFRRSKNALLSTMDNIGRGSKDLVMDFIDTLTGKPRPEDADAAEQDEMREDTPQQVDDNQ